MIKRLSWNTKQFKKIALQCLKIAIGSSLAIWIAQHLHLQFAASAGSIALLTIVATKWETVYLSVYRLITFFISMILAYLTMGILQSEWIAYGIYIFFTMIIAYSFGWQSTISVNAVIGTNFLQTRDFSLEFIWNEFQLVAIGITIALILNLFYDYDSQKRHLIQCQKETEISLQMILGEIAAYLAGKEMRINVWHRVQQLQQDLEEHIDHARHYQDNTFVSHPEYYIQYFEMRMRQTEILHNLHYEMRKIRQMPKQAKIVSEYIVYMSLYVLEHNIPEKQLNRLHEIFEEMKIEPLPQSREEFESRAVLYHILMDLEDFLWTKKRFIDQLDEKQRELYWQE